MIRSVVTTQCYAKRVITTASRQSLRLWRWGIVGGYRGGSPTAVRPSDPALCGSRPL